MSVRETLENSVYTYGRGVCIISKIEGVFRRIEVEIAMNVHHDFYS